MVSPACARGSDSSQNSNHAFTPAYKNMDSDHAWDERIDKAWEIMKQCTLCPRRCRVDRTRGDLGFCRAPESLVVASYQPHFGEERPLTGQRGSGTIFFSNCNLRCVFCQNWPIAHEGRGREVTEEALATMMLRLQRQGCHNINLVTPTHVMPHILKAVRLASHQGLRLPLVYNTGGYERPEILSLLDGIVDIYMPDLKFMDSKPAGEFLGAEDYPEMARASIQTMYQQVGPLQINRQGLATRGLMIRHLVMPNRLSNAKAFAEWVATTLSPEVYVNIMAQYRVEFRAFEFPSLSRAITPEEFIEAIEWAKAAGLNQLDQRSLTHFRIHRSS